MMCPSCGSEDSMVSVSESDDIPGAYGETFQVIAICTVCQHEVLE